jgi:hypothetical protein
MNIHKATKRYENWMRSCTAVIEAHLRLKHKRMRESPFLFFRGTFYRWAQLWPKVCSGLRDVPLYVGVVAKAVSTHAVRTRTKLLVAKYEAAAHADEQMREHLRNTAVARDLRS